VTEFRVANQKVYLSPIYDLFDHSIVSFTTGISPSTALTSQSLEEALEREQPGAGVLIHTDQGFQYQHVSWRAVLEKHEAVQSMSRKANCYDNAMIENFFGHLKTEMFHGETFNTVNELITSIEEYIDWYNNERIQERLKGMTPMQYRNHALQLEAA
jgi:transposase InsO family protein